MIQSNRTAFLFILFLASITQSFAKDNEIPQGTVQENSSELFEDVVLPEPEKPEFSDHELQLIDQLIHQAFKELSRLDESLETVAFLLAKKDVIIPNRDAIFAELRKLRSITGEFLQETFTLTTHNDPRLKLNTAHQILLLCHEISTNFKEALNNRLRSLEPFDLQRLMKRSSQPSSINMVQKNMKAIHERNQWIKKTSEQLGLTWYNKAARGIDWAVVQPIAKYKLHKIGAFAALSAFMACYFTAQFGNIFSPKKEAIHGYPIDPSNGLPYDTIPRAYDRDTRRYYYYPSAPESHRLTYPDQPTSQANSNQPWFSKFKNWVGTGVPLNHRGDEPNLDNPDYNKFNKATYHINKVWYGLDPIASQCVATMGTALAGTYLAAKDSINRFCEKTWNFLRGGAYKEKAVKGNWQFMPTHGFEKLIGLEHVRSEFNMVLQFIQQPEACIRKGAIPSKAYLLTGPPGTGKTFAVEALCGEIVKLTQQNSSSEFQFLKINGSLIKSYPGGVESLLEDARHLAPCIIIIDEIDLLGLQRIANNDLLSQFLNSMGNTLSNDPSKPVIIIGATNKPETMDKALFRDGRFKEIRLTYPSFESRKEFFEHELSNYGLDTSKFNLEKLALDTENKTIESIRAVIRRAIIMAWMIGQQISQVLLEYALDKEMHNIVIEQEVNLPQEEKNLLASYYAGRATALRELDNTQELSKITIKQVAPELKEELVYDEYCKEEDQKQQKIRHGGIFTRSKRSNSAHIVSREEQVNMIKIHLAGACAQELLCDTISFGNRNDDYTKSYDLALHTVCEGLNPKNLPSHIRKKYEVKAHELFETCKQEVKDLLKQHMNTLSLIRDKLMEYELLSGRQIEQMIKKAKESGSETAL